MPPHCDSLDGPVVRAAQRALDAANVAIVLAFVPQRAEKEIVETFDKVMAARRSSAAGREVADRYFFETVVRVHRAGEGAPFTGLKPAGLDVGPVIPIAEKAVDSGDPAALEGALVTAVREGLAERFHHLQHLRDGAQSGLHGAREYVTAMLGLQVWAHGIYQATKTTAHAGPHTHD